MSRRTSGFGLAAMSRASRNPKRRLGRAQPFWSSLSRVQRIIKTVQAYGIFEPYELTWNDFETVWVPNLNSDGVKVGVNWSGKGATGYDIDPNDVVANVRYHLRAEGRPSGEG
jgi:hypothetical protein